MTIQIFKAYWQNFGPDLSIEAGDEASYNEWTDEYGKNYGMREPGGAQHGIVRTIDSDGNIIEGTYFEDEPHGLSFFWENDNNDLAFGAFIYDHGERKAFIWWDSDWSEIFSENKELMLENNGLNNFKP